MHHCRPQASTVHNVMEGVVVDGELVTFVGSNRLVTRSDPSFVREGGHGNVTVANVSIERSSSKVCSVDRVEPGVG